MPPIVLRLGGCRRLRVERTDALLLVLEFEPDRHALFLAGGPRRVTPTGEIVDVLHRTGRQVNLAFGYLELSAPGEIDDVLTLGTDMPVAEAAGRCDPRLHARHLLHHRLRIQHDIFDMRQAIRAGVDS